MFSRARTNCHGSTVRCLYARPLFETAKRDGKSMLRANVLGFGIVNLWVIPCRRMLNQLTASRADFTVIVNTCDTVQTVWISSSEEISRQATYVLSLFLTAPITINIGSNPHPIIQVGRTWPQLFFHNCNRHTLTIQATDTVFCMVIQYAPVNQIKFFTIRPQLMVGMGLTRWSGKSKFLQCLLDSFIQILFALELLFWQNKSHESDDAYVRSTSSCTQEGSPGTQLLSHQ